MTTDTAVAAGRKPSTGLKLFTIEDGHAEDMDWTSTPSLKQAIERVSTGVAVGLTLLVVGEPPSTAVVVGTTVVILVGVGDLAERVVGDYANNVVLGLLALGLTGWLTVESGPSVPAGGFGIVGTWLLIDGVQHLRYGVDRGTVTDTYSHGGGAITGVLGVLWRRLLEPFRL
ncbi:MAG: hypothetical protein ABEI98_08395 [Halorhabdus sp.]